MDEEILKRTQGYTIKIKVGNEVSSGVIYASDQDDYLYVLTSLHSISAFFFAEKEYPDFELGYYDGYSLRHYSCVDNPPEYCCLAQAENGVIDWKSCIGTDKDIAVFRIPSAAFNEDGSDNVKFLKLRIWPENENISSGMKLYGKGYPNDKKIPVELKADFNGCDEKRYDLKCTLENINNLENMMHGYSGGGLFSYSNEYGLRLVCLTTGCDENESNNHFYAVKPYDIIEKMKEQGWIVPKDESNELPDSLVPFINPTVEMVSSIKKDARDYIDVSIRELLEDKGLIPSCYYGDEQKDKFSEFLCCDNCCACQYYWKGQLIKAICFCKIAGIDISELKDMKINIGDSKDIQVEFICSDTPAEEFIKELLYRKFNLSDGIVKDGTIFLWNGKKDQMYNDSASREEINGILVNLVSNSNRTKLSASGTKLLKDTGYDIVNGSVPYFNFSIIGIQELTNTVIGKGKGNEKLMKNDFEQILAKNWSIE